MAGPANLAGFGCCGGTSQICVQVICTSCGVAGPPTPTTGSVRIYNEATDKTFTMTSYNGCVSASLPAGTYNYTLTTGHGVQTGTISKPTPGTNITFTVRDSGSPSCGCGAPDSVMFKPLTPTCNRDKWLAATFGCKPPPLPTYANGEGSVTYGPGFVGMFSDNLQTDPYGPAFYYELTCAGGTHPGASAYTVALRIAPNGGGTGTPPPSLLFTVGSDDPFGYSLSNPERDAMGAACTAMYTLS